MKKSIIESARPRGIGGLIDMIYKELDHSSDSSEKLQNLLDQISIYYGGSRGAQGSSRAALMISKTEVLKLALNEAGFAQNGIEAHIGNDSEVEDIVVPVTMTSNIVENNGYLWIVAKRVKPVDMDPKDPAWINFRAKLKDAAIGKIKEEEVDQDQSAVAIPKAAAERLKAQKMAAEKIKYEKGEKSFLDAVTEATPDFFRSFSALISKYKDINTGDLYKPDSWGLDGNKLKLIDAGFTKSISTGYYKGHGLGKGLTFAGGEKAKKTETEREEQLQKSKSAKLEKNADAARDALTSTSSSYPEESALLFFLKGLVEPLPPAVASGEPSARLTRQDISSASTVVSDSYDKIKKYISTVKDESLASSLESGLDGVMAMRGSIQKESIVREYVRMLLGASR